MGRNRLKKTPHGEDETLRFLPGLRVGVRPCSSAVPPPPWRPCLSRRAGDLRYSLRPTHPGDAPLRVRPPRRLGRARRADCWGRECALEGRGDAVGAGEPAARLRLGGLAPIPPAAAPPYSGRGKRVVALASASRSSPAQAPAWRSAQHGPSSSSPPPPPAQLLAHPQPPPPRPEPLATSPRQPAAPARSGRNGTSAAALEALPANREASRGGTRKRFPRPGSCGRKAKAFEDPNP